MFAQSTSDNSTSYRPGARVILGVTLFASANLCLFGTFEIFQANRSEFGAALGDLLPILIGLCLGLTALLSFMGLALPRRFRRMFVSIVLAGGLLLWLQGSFLRWDYGEFDGTGIDWTSLAWRGWVDTAIWLMTLITAVRFRRRLARHALFIALAFVIIQSGLYVARARTISEEETGAAAQKDDSGVVPQALCGISSSRNVFHFIMDSFQGDIFMELAGEDGLAESFDGFVVFPENISNGGRTVLAVPAAFSTNVYDGSETESEYYHKAAVGSFHYLLHNNGYVVNLMPHIPMSMTAHTNHYMKPAVYAQSHRARVIRAAAFLIDVGMFRQFPHFMKQAVYNDQNWRLSTLFANPPTHVSFHQKAFFADYMGRLEAVHTEPVYHFIHLMPPHKPLTTLADGSYAGKVLPFNRENFKNEARAIIKLFINFLDKLKELGVYDNSVVLVHGDHGAGLRPMIDDREMTERMGRVSALLLIKPFSARGPLRVSKAYTSLSDIPATLLELVGFEHPYPGESILKQDVARIPARRVVFVTDRAAREPTVNRYVIRGSVYDPASWHELKPRKMQKTPGAYEWGTKMGFGITGSGDKYLTHGWSTTSPTLHWNMSESAEMVFTVTEPPSDVRFEIRFLSNIPREKNIRQLVKLTVNGKPASEVVCYRKEWKRFYGVIPKHMLRSGRMVFLFEFPGMTEIETIGLYRFEAYPVAP